MSGHFAHDHDIVERRRRGSVADGPVAGYFAHRQRRTDRDLEFSPAKHLKGSPEIIFPHAGEITQASEVQSENRHVRKLVHGAKHGSVAAEHQHHVRGSVFDHRQSDSGRELRQFRGHRTGAGLPVVDIKTDCLHRHLRPQFISMTLPPERRDFSAAKQIRWLCRDSSVVCRISSSSPRRRMRTSSETRLKSPPP